MTKILLLTMMFILVSFEVKAQSLVFRSGEHDDYTRLVAELPQDVQWSVEDGESVLRIVFSTTFSTVDISNIFRRIDRSRISAINVLSDNRGIDIMLACNCGFRSFLEEGSLLVIDVGEGFSEQTSEEGGASEGRWASGDNVSLQSANLPLFGNNATSPLVLPLLLSDSVHQTAVSELGGESSTGMSKVLLSTQPTENQTDPYLGNLPAEIANAAAQGLLVPSYPLDPSFDVNPSSDGRERHPNINTLVATEMPGTEETAINIVDGGVCPNSEDFNLPSWGHTAGFSTGLSEWRQSLTQEFDRLDVSAAIGLAKHYLHYGFGKEALAALTLLAQSDPQVEHLKRVARVVDIGHDPRKVDVSWMMACDGPVALWSVLSSEDVLPPDQLDVSALRLAFEDLPQALKQHLGPQLATRFAVSGDTVTAEAILSSVERGNSAPNPALQFAQANLRGYDPQEGSGQFSDIVSADSDLSPLALVAIVDSAVSADQPIDKNQVDLVAAYVFEHRGTDLSRELARAHVLALAFSGQFVEALDRLAQLEEGSPKPIDLLTRSQVMTRLLENADDVSFLSVALGWSGSGVSAALENRIAERLLNMGFAEAALEIIFASVEGSDGRTRRVMRAEAALLLNEPVVAEAELMGLTGDDVVSLRMEARRRQGDFSLAPTVGQEDINEQQRRDLAWLSGNASLLETTSVSNTQPTVEQPDGARDLPDALDEMPSGMLGQAESLIDNSSETRIALQDLLSRFPVQTVPTP